MAVVYLSPHFDDAVYSCGGLIHRQAAAGAVVRVVTLCAGQPPAGPLSPFAESLHARWGVAAAEAVAVRAAEDRAALRLLGAQAVHLDVPDCIYRRHPETGAPLYAAEAALFGPLDPAEDGRVEALAAELDHLLGQADTGQLYAPLGLGRHVDHQLTRAVAERLGRPLTFYEDFPYAARTPEGPAWDGLAAGCQPRLAEIDQQDLDFYCLAVGAYRSQLSTFWTDETAMRADVRGFCTRLAAGGLGLRLWDTQSA